MLNMFSPKLLVICSQLYATVLNKQQQLTKHPPTHNTLENCTENKKKIFFVQKHIRMNFGIIRGTHYFCFASRPFFNITTKKEGVMNREMWKSGCKRFVVYICKLIPEWIINPKSLSAFFYKGNLQFVIVRKE